LAVTSWLSLLVGAVLMLAGIAVTPELIESARDAYDRANPIVRAVGVEVRRGPGEVTVQARFEKLRDCKRVSIEAFSRHSGTGALVRANIERIGSGGQELRNIQPGESTFSSWRIWPVVDSSAVVVYMSHRCLEREVWTKVVEVKL
jgi:hypothetical protein